MYKSSRLGELMHRRSWWWLQRRMPRLRVGFATAKRGHAHEHRASKNTQSALRLADFQFGLTYSVQKYDRRRPAQPMSGTIGKYLIGGDATLGASP